MPASPGGLARARSGAGRGEAGGGGLGVGRGVVGGEQLMEAEPGEVRQGRNAPRHQRPGEPERPARGLLSEALAEQRGATVRPGGCGKRHMIGVVGQTWVPKRVEIAKILALMSHGRANGGLSE